MSNFEEYENPERYDAENEAYKPELPLLSEYAKLVCGPITDLACGTGRTAIPLAELGFSVTGIDIQKNMLNRAKEKGAQRNVSINWLHADLTDFKLAEKSKLLYMVGNSFQHFLTNEDQDNLLKCVAASLQEGGYFIFDTRFPCKEELLQPVTEEYWKTYKEHKSGLSVQLSTISHYDDVRQIQHYVTIRKFIKENGEVQKESRTNIKLRYVYPQELKRLLASHQLEMVAIYEDWNKTPLKNGSQNMICICRK
ncbi:class I SAM-dependent DNA methyltransferase [Niallia sp. FSL R7-0271]|uniref:class I SAM-dependent DNA methyltransferase n=1 Tax=Niallia sp. FSL R7-0271 TaxID=2921678 RepID=UPI0030F7815E